MRKIIEKRTVVCPTCNGCGKIDKEFIPVWVGACMFIMTFGGLALILAFGDKVSAPVDIVVNWLIQLFN